MKGATGNRSGAFCPSRTGYAGAPRPHKFTSKVNKPEPARIICSWCGVTKPNKKGKKKR